MKTEIKNTLFNFVTMRAPQLLDDNEKYIRFVLRDKKLINGVFDNAVRNRLAGITKW